MIFLKSHHFLDGYMGNFFTRKYEVFLLTLLISLSFFIRFHLTSFNLRYPDAVYYLQLAKEILQGNFYVDFYGDLNFRAPSGGPIYPFFTAIFSLLFNDLELSGALVSIFSGSLLIIPLFILSKKAYGTKTVWASSIMITFSPSLIHYSTVMLSEGMFIFFFVSTLLLGWYTLNRGKSSTYFLLGIAAGILLLTRVIGGVGFFIILFWTVIFAVLNKSHFRTLAIRILLLTIGWVLVAGPYFGFAFYSKKVTSLNNRKIAIVEIIKYTTKVTNTDNVPSEDSVLSGNNTHSKKTSHLLKGYYTILKKFSRDFIYRLQSLLSSFPPFFLVLLLAGLLLRTPWDKNKIINDLYLFSWISFYLMALSFSGYNYPRFNAPLIPIFAIWIGNGIAETSERISHIFIKKDNPLGYKVKILLFSLLILSIPVAFAGELRHLEEKHSPEYEKYLFSSGHKEMGRWIKENLRVQPKTYIYDRKPFSAYYIGGYFAYLPQQIDQQFVMKAQKRGKGYLVADSKIIEIFHPKLRYLISGEEVPEGLTLIYQRYFADYQKIISVYKIMPMQAFSLDKKSFFKEASNNSAEEHYRIGNIYLQEGYLMQAKSEFLSALKKRPDYADAYFGLVNIYHIKRLFDKTLSDQADAEFREALRIRSDDPYARNNLGNIYAKMGLLEQAIEEYKELLRIYPAYVVAHFNLGLAYERKGSHEQAINHYQRFLDLASPNHRETIVTAKRRIKVLMRKE